MASKFVEYKPNGLSPMECNVGSYTASLKQSRKQEPNSGINHNLTVLLQRRYNVIKLVL